MSSVHQGCQYKAPDVDTASVPRVRKTRATGSTLSRFRRDERGVVAIMFAGVFVLLFAFVGTAVDFGRWLSVRDNTLRAMDAAVLAAGRAMQINGLSNTQALEVARRYFDENKNGRLDFENVTFQLEQNGTVIASISRSSVNTPFLGFMGVPQLEVNAVSRAVLSAGGNSGTNIEISLMLDTTGSMGWEGKMGDLKDAATDLIDIVVWEDQSNYYAKVGLAPFSEHVNVGRDYYKDVTHRSSIPGNNVKRTCVRERKKSNKKYTDDQPNYNGRFQHYPGGGTCKSGNVIVPMTNDKQVLKDAIDDLETTGGTAGHLGTAWAWYLLSPNFNSIWPSASDAAPYSDLNAINTVTHGDQTLEVPKLKKIAVLMTDGTYNRQYNGINSSTQAKQLCTAMKNKGIEVYAIGFKLPSSGSAQDVMSSCATSEEHFYDADNGEELRLAFRDIALKISTLRLME
ncbi:MAG: pilus assembly protein [Pseudomonadota bacterium]